MKIIPRQFTKVEFGYETKMGALKPYIEAGLGVSYPDGGGSDSFKALEVGTKLKVTDKFSAYGK